MLGLLYIVGSFLVVEIGYSNFGFNNHVSYTNIKSSVEHNLTVIEQDLCTEDDFKIHIYEVIIPQPKGVVIMLSGITGPSVTHFYGEAELVSTVGFASILVDARGHGKSAGDKVTLAIDDVKDVDAVVEYIKNNPQYKDLPIVVMGVSMGGATAVNAASLNPEIDGLIAMSAFSSWTDVCVDVIEVQGWPRWIGNLLRPSIAIHGFFNYGIDFFKIVPEKTIQQIGDKPILFIHCTKDKQVPIANHHRLLEKYTGNNAEVWIRDSDCHFVVNNNQINYPLEDSEYCNRILNFLSENFHE